MTSLQPTQAQVLVVPEACDKSATVNTDSVVKIRHGFSLIPKQLVVRDRKTPMHCLTVV